MKFYGLDGDKIGSIIELYMIEGKIDELSTFSKKVEIGLENIKDIVIRENGKIIFCAGDSILFQGQFSHDWCNNVLGQFLSYTGRTVSMGVGDAAIEAYLALKLAKATGGGKIVYFSL